MKSPNNALRSHHGTALSEVATKGSQVCLKVHWLLVTLFLFLGCSEKKNGVFTREQMWEWMGHHVKVGMPIDAASSAMEKAGFSCSSHSKTSTKIVDSNKTATTGVFDFVLCEREDGSPPIKRHWEVTLVHEASHVTAVGLRYRDDYPRSGTGGEKTGS